MMPEEEENKYKTCIHCIHWYFQSGESAWSEQTPGFNWFMGCNKEHFIIDGDDTADGEIRKELLRAPTCKDFEDR